MAKTSLTKIKFLQKYLNYTPPPFHQNTCYINPYTGSWNQTCVQLARHHFVGVVQESTERLKTVLIQSNELVLKKYFLYKQPQKDPLKKYFFTGLFQ